MMCKKNVSKQNRVISSNIHNCGYTTYTLGCLPLLLAPLVVLQERERDSVYVPDPDGRDPVLSANKHGYPSDLTELIQLVVERHML